MSTRCGVPLQNPPVSSRSLLVKQVHTVRTWSSVCEKVQVSLGIRPQRRLLPKVPGGSGGSPLWKALEGSSSSMTLTGHRPLHSQAEGGGHGAAEVCTSLKTYVPRKSMRSFEGRSEPPAATLSATPPGVRSHTNAYTPGTRRHLPCCPGLQAPHTHRAGQEILLLFTHCKYWPHASRTPHARPTHAPGKLQHPPQLIAGIGITCSSS